MECRAGQELFNIFGFVLRLLRSIPHDITELLRACREEIIDLGQKPRHVPDLRNTQAGVRAEGMEIRYRNTELYSGSRIYKLYLLMKVVILSDYSVTRVSSMRQVP